MYIGHALRWRKKCVSDGSILLKGAHNKAMAWVCSQPYKWFACLTLKQVLGNMKAPPHKRCQHSELGHSPVHRCLQI